MRGNNAQDNAENHAGHKGDDGMSAEKNLHAWETVGYLFFFIVDALFFWFENHLLALLIGGGAIIFILWRVLPLGHWLFSIAVVTVLVPVLYAAIGPILAPETEVIGLLQPGNSPTPPNGCDHAPPEAKLAADTLKVLIGDNAIAKIGPGRFTALQIGECKVLGMDRTPNGVGIFADLYGRDGKLIAKIAENSIHVLTGERVHMSRGGDLSTLIITTPDDDLPTLLRWLLGSEDIELLRVKFLNATTIQATGLFGCPGHLPVLVTDQQPVPGVFMSGSCFAAAGVGIRVN
jgi:hypothetical protein